MCLDAQMYDKARLLFDRIPTLPTEDLADSIQRECFQFLESYQKLQDMHSYDKILLDKGSSTSSVIQAQQTILNHLQPLKTSRVVNLSKLCKFPPILGYPDTHYQPLNPNIIFDPWKKEFKVLCRAVNYRQDITTGLYTIYDPQSVIRTRNFMMSFNTHLQLLKVHEVIDDCKEIRRYPSFARGLEDMRLLWKEEHLVFSATTIETSPTSSPTIAMGIIGMEPTETEDVENEDTECEGEKIGNIEAENAVAENIEAENAEAENAEAENAEAENAEAENAESEGAKTGGNRVENTKP
jgi:hypothetical protein